MGANKTMDVEQQLHSHALFREYEHVLSICAPLKYLDIEGFIFMRHFADGSFIDLSTNLSWSSFFLTRYLQGVYPIESTNDHMFIEYGVSLWKMNQDNIIWREGERHFGYDNGISISVRHSDFTDIFCYYNKSEAVRHEQGKIDFYLTKLDLLHNFNRYFASKSDGILRKASQHKLITPDKYLANLPKSTNQKKIEKFLHIVTGHSVANLGLNQRERDCIGYCSQGYSAKEIAHRLSLSPRTVESHLDNAKNKLNCKNICELFFLYNQFNW